MVDRRFKFVNVGYSYRLTELEGALGLEGLATIGAKVARRKKNATFLMEALAQFSEDLQLPATAREAENVYFCLPLVIKKKSKVKRNDLVTFLEEHGIETRYLMPLLSQPVYRNLFPGEERKYPIAEWVSKNGFYIGCHENLSMRDLRYIVSVFVRFFARRGQVARSKPYFNQ